MEYGKSSYWLMSKDLQTARCASETHSRWHRNYMNCHALSGVGVLYSPFRQITPTSAGSSGVCTRKVRFSAHPFSIYRSPSCLHETSPLAT
jgi:hypothetical protein